MKTIEQEQVRDATTEVVARAQDRDKSGHLILSQTSIDWNSPDNLSMHASQRMGQVVGSADYAPRPRSLRERIRDYFERSRNRRTHERQIDIKRRF